MGKKSHGKAWRYIGGYCWEGCHRFVVDVELEGCSMEEISLEDGDHGSCSLKMRCSALEEESEPVMVVHQGLVVSGYLYRVIHKSLRNFRTRLRNNQDRHDRKEHINR